MSAQSGLCLEATCDRPGLTKSCTVSVTDLHQVDRNVIGAKLLQRLMLIYVQILCTQILCTQILCTVSYTLYAETASAIWY